MQIDIMVVSEEDKSEVINVIEKQNKHEISVGGFKEIRNLDGDLPLAIFNISADFVIGTSAGVFATYIYELLKSVRAKRARIDEEEIDIIKEAVEQAVIKAITRSVEDTVKTSEDNHS